MSLLCRNSEYQLLYLDTISIAPIPIFFNVLIRKNIMKLQKILQISLWFLVTLVL